MDDQQMQAMVESWRQKLQKDLAELRLRQWCVEKAIEIAPRLNKPANFGELCEMILKFVSAPFEDVFKDDGEKNNG